MGQVRCARVDASSLIYVGKCDAFELVHRLLSVLDVPPAVWREVVDEGDRLGAVEVGVIRSAESRGWLRRIPLTPRQVRTAATVRSVEGLGAGESEVIAVVTPGGPCVIDENRASRVARVRGLKPFPTILLPVLGWRSGVFDEMEAIQLLSDLSVASGALAEIIVRLEKEIRGGIR
jgi:predicted nucleic acid-binding protein